MVYFKHTRWIFAVTLVSLLMTTMALARPSQRRIGADKVTSYSLLGLGSFDDDDDDDRGRGRGRRHRRDDRDDDSDRHDRRDRVRDRDEDRDGDDDGDRDEDEDLRGRRRSVRDRNHDDVFNRRDVERVALQNGARAGFRAGRNDRARGRDFDFRDHDAFRDATVGYRREFGDLDSYRRTFREGFRQGYEEGFGGRNLGRESRGSRIGDIFGGVFGRP